MSFPAYTAYKDSEVPWLSDVPSHWNISRVKDLFEIRKRIAGELGHDVLSITQSGLRVKDIESNEGQQAMDYSKYQLVHSGDFAMNHMDLLTGWIDIASRSGVTSPDYRVFAARDPGNINERFFLRAFQMAYTARQFYPFGQGSSQLGRWRLPTGAFNAFPLPVPPATEQAAIATFLDREIAKIDRLVAEQEWMIALLKEKRQAVISHAVTKGLNTSAPMKDSGVEWLGEIPAHWELLQLRRVLELQRGHDLPSDSRRPGDVPVVSSGGIIDTHDESITSEPCIVTGRYGSIGKFNFVEEPCWPLNTALYTTRLTGNARYQFYMLHNLSPIFEAFAAKSAVPGVDRNDLHPLYVCQPPLNEQEEIVDFLEGQFSQNKLVLDEAVSLIELLKERRAALVSSAVTGKIDVRGMASNSNVVSIDSARPTQPLPSLRAVIGSLVIAKLGEKGRMVVMKGGYLAEAHCGMNDIGGRYQRYAAGPYDSGLIAAMERGADELCGIKTIVPPGDGDRVTYQMARSAPALSDELEMLVGETKASAFSKMLADLDGIGREGIEAVATIYAVWNDLIASGRAADDDTICNGVLNDWHVEKRQKFKRADLDHWLDWMRRNGFVPVGTAPRTDHQASLFQ